MKMKYGLVIFFSLVLASCAGPPTLSKSATIDTLSISAIGTTSITGTGGFYDYSQPSTTISGGVTSITSYTETPISFPGGPFSFNDMTHDTLGFAITFTSGPLTFAYQFDTLSQSVTVNASNPSYTSGRISF